VLELRECPTGLLVVAGRADADDSHRVHVQIDRSWALQILSGQVSPVVILDRRLGRMPPPAVQEIRAAVGKRRLSRVDSRLANRPAPTAREHAPEELRAATG
jgi:hypothetical protein